MNGQAALQPRAPVPSAALVSRVAVDAGGVPAQWIEATVATPGQPTVVFFGWGSRMWSEWEDERRLADRVALDSGARVLRIGGGPLPVPSREALVREGLSAYVWLLGEGVDLRTTTFMDAGDASGVAGAVLRAARLRRLPLPAGGVRSLDRAVLHLG